VAKPVRLRRLAADDIDDAGDYFEAEALAGVAARFVDALERALHISVGADTTERFASPTTLTFPNFAHGRSWGSRTSSSTSREPTRSTSGASCTPVATFPTHSPAMASNSATPPKSTRNTVKWLPSSAIGERSEQKTACSTHQCCQTWQIASLVDA
jgi:hypothetical protein